MEEKIKELNKRVDELTSLLSEECEAVIISALYRNEADDTSGVIISHKGNLYTVSGLARATDNYIKEISDLHDYDLDDSQTE